MKVKCINNNGWKGITVGKTYEVKRYLKNYELYRIINDDEVEKDYYTGKFEEVKEMGKEKVLEVEFQEVFDKVAWRIIYQNTDVLQRNRFEDRELRVRSCMEPSNDSEFLFLRGDLIHKDIKVCVATKEEAEIIKQKVDAINEKYGIPKRWRAKEGDEYWYIHMSSGLNCFTDREGEHIPLATDFFRHKNRYNCGNYFRTRDEALSKLKEIERILKGE